jgi:hypothetical protein
MRIGECVTSAGSICRKIRQAQPRRARDGATRDRNGDRPSHQSL